MENTPTYQGNNLYFVNKFMLIDFSLGKNLLVMVYSSLFKQYTANFIDKNCHKQNTIS